MSELLTLNPQVANAPNQPVTDTRHASAQVPTAAIPAPVELRPFVTPPTVREGSAGRYKLMAEHYKQDSTSLQLNPQVPPQSPFPHVVSWCPALTHPVTGAAPPPDIYP